jgi:hypothetical protein
MQTLKIEKGVMEKKQIQIIVIIKGQAEKMDSVEKAIEKLVTYIQKQDKKPGSVTVRIMRRKPLRTKNIVFVCDPINIISHQYIKNAMKSLGYIPLFESHKRITFVQITSYASLENITEIN